MRFLWILLFTLPAHVRATSVGERVLLSLETRACAESALKVEEIELREFALPARTDYFQRRHEHAVICDTNLRIPDVGPVRVVANRGATRIYSVDGRRVRVVLADKCYAVEHIPSTDPSAKSPKLKERTERARAECMAKAKKLLESNSVIELDFDVQIAE